MIICALLVFSILLLVCAGRMLPILDSVCQTIKLPMAYIPPVTPYILIAVAATFLFYIVFKLALPEKAH